MNVMISKTFQPGDAHRQFHPSFNVYVDQSDAYGPKWMTGFTMTPIVKNSIEAMFSGR